MSKAARVIPVLILLVVSVQAVAQSRNSAVTSGLTSVYSEFKDGIYLWTLTNDSQADTTSSFDVLVWELIPYQVNEPASWIAPAGWEWSGDRWELISAQRYFTPYAVAPGQSIRFSYTPDPQLGIVNPQGPQPQGLGFVTHVAAVVPGSGSPDGLIRWAQASSEYGGTWHDRAVIHDEELSTIPEAPGILVLAAGMLMMAAWSCGKIVR